MKRLLFILSICVLSSASDTVFAQSFEVEHVTIVTGVLGHFSIPNKIHNITSVNDTLQWTVVSCDWPSSWLANIGVCDNTTCLGATTVFTPNNEAVYPPGWGDFRLDGDVAATDSAGPYTLRIRFKNKYNANDTAWQTYIISKAPVSTPTVIKTASTDVSLYPNPATNTLNVVYNAGAEIKNVSIYSIIGKQVSQFKVTDDNSASLNVDGLPAGVYFVRLINAHGDVFATRKFTKQ